MATKKCLECERVYDPKRDGGDVYHCRRCKENVQEEFDSLPEGSYSAIDDD